MPLCCLLGFHLDCFVHRQLIFISHREEGPDFTKVSLAKIAHCFMHNSSVQTN